MNITIEENKQEQLENTKKEIQSIFQNKEYDMKEKEKRVIELFEATLIVGKEVEKEKLYPSGCINSSHERYKTKDKMYTFIIAYDWFDKKGYYFYLANQKSEDKDFEKQRYNSLWYGKSYKTLEECTEAAENWLWKYKKRLKSIN